MKTGPYRTLSRLLAKETLQLVGEFLSWDNVLVGDLLAISPNREPPQCPTLRRAIYRSNSPTPLRSSPFLSTQSEEALRRAKEAISVIGKVDEIPSHLIVHPMGQVEIVISIEVETPGFSDCKKLRVI